MRDDLRIHACLADTASDQLRILRPEIDDQHGAGRGGRHPDSLVRHPRGR
ncbi:GMP synthase domain protein [Mycolicibacterium hassiacum DSM 44199]|uniref:GMP synthase domain protein n=1 Tax=Mycolicibacterium hassiacum (strain DSM 44199 / CIP 105218 / JCM 12690 / 3849) TaxID=1122247 RepID=K5BKF6_MYCHD|nr:GMP synthase domain protein [Mycolicibacterium hassiacum DSM 44199]